MKLVYLAYISHILLTLGTMANDLQIIIHVG